MIQRDIRFLSMNDWGCTVVGRKRNLDLVGTVRRPKYGRGHPRISIVRKERKLRWELSSWMVAELLAATEAQDGRCEQQVGPSEGHRGEALDHGEVAGGGGRPC